MADYVQVRDPSTGGVRQDCVIRQSDAAAIFAGSSDWRDYHAWCDAGGRPDPAPPPATAVVNVTGNQWTFALSDLGLSAAWQAAIAKSKASDQLRIGLIARDTSLVVSDPLLVRVAANAGVDGTGAPTISVSAVFAHARAMPT